MDPTLIDQIQRQLRGAHHQVYASVNNSIQQMTHSIAALGRGIGNAPARLRQQQLLAALQQTYTQTANRIDKELGDAIHERTKLFGLFPRYSQSSAKYAAQLMREIRDQENILQNRINYLRSIGVHTAYGLNHDQEVRMSQDILDAREAELRAIKKLPTVLEFLGVVATGLAVSFFHAWNTFRDAGFDFSQTGAAIRNIAGTPFSQALDKKVVTWGDLEKANVSFATNQLFAGTPTGLTSGIASYTTSGGKDIETLTQVQYRMMQVHGWSSKVANNWVETTRAMATAYNIPLDKLTQRVAENMNLLANSANRGAGDLDKLVARNERLGLSPQIWGRMADSLTGNFEGYLDSQAKLQTILPGFDLTGVMMASQFGSDEDVQNALTAQLGGRDIGKLPRSLRNMIAGSLGMSVEDLVKVGSEKNMPQELQIKSNTLLEDIRNILRDQNSTGAFVKGLIGRMFDLTDGPLMQTFKKYLPLFFLNSFLFKSGSTVMGNIAGAANNFGVGALSPMALGMGMVPLLRLGGLSGVVSGVSDLNEGHSFGHAGLSALSSAGGAIGGSMVGRWIGGMLGSAGGPAGAIVGSMIGGYAADKLIDMLWTEAPEQENLKLHGAKKAEESNQKVFVQLDAIHKSTQDTVVAINNLTKAFKDTPVQKIRDTAHQVVMVSARTP
jgi:hypothetical protein